MPTVSTANVNGVRAATVKGLLDWIVALDADVICLQEVRARPERGPARADDAARRAWTCTSRWRRRRPRRAATASPCCPAPSRGRAGRASATRSPTTRAATWRSTSPTSRAASLYLPKGVTGTAKQERKDRFLDRFAPYLDDAWRRAHDAGREMVVCGDWNLAPAEADVRNWRNNRTNSGFLPHEREWWAALVERGWVDAVRAVHPDARGPVLVVDLPRAGVRQRRGLADRSPARDTGARRAGQGRRRRPGAVARRALVGPRPRHGAVRAGLRPGGRGAKQRH